MTNPACKFLMPRQVKRALLVLIMIIVWGTISLDGCFAQVGIKPVFPQAKWIRDRGPFDPRPYDNTLLGDGLVFNKNYFEFKNRLWIDKGISYGGYFSANLQLGSVGTQAHDISETLFLFTWEPVRKSNSAGRLVVGFAHDLTFGNPTTRQFANNQNLVETPNDLDTDPELTFTTLGLLHWTHEWRTGPNQGYGLRVGQLYAPSYFGPARYLDDDRRFFMARPLAAAAGAQWVGFNDIGLGVNGIIWKSPAYISIGIMDGNANRKYPDFESLFKGKMLYLLELGLEKDVDGPNEAAVRVTLSHLDIDDDQGPGQSIMISGDIHFEGEFAVAGRWSKSFNRLTSDYQDLVSIGFMWVTPFGRAQDLSGFGFFSGKPSDITYQQESGFELFYKLQLTHALGLMPDVQYWFRNDEGNLKTRTWVLGLRTEIEF